MMSFNHVVLAGNVGRDPETRTTKEGTTVTSFSLAVDTYQGKDENGKAKEAPLWVRVNAWQKLAETAAKMVQKGSPVLVSGKLHLHTYTDKNDEERTSIEVRADEIKLLSSKAKPEEAKVA